MLLSLLRKSDFLREQLGDSKLDAAYTKFLEQTAQDPQIGDVSKTLAPLLPTLFIEGAYPFIKHRAWHRCQILADLSTEHLQSTGHLPAKTAAIIHSILHATLDHFLLLPSSSLALENVTLENDDEFLFSLLVDAITSKDQSTAIDAIGLGEHILHRFKSALESAANTIGKSNSDSPVFFIPNLEFQLQEAVLRMSKGIRSTPHFPEAEKLKYLVLESAACRSLDPKKTHLKHLPALVRFATSASAQLLCDVRSLGSESRVDESTCEFLGKFANKFSSINEVPGLISELTAELTALLIDADILFLADTRVTFGRQCNAFGLTLTGKNLTHAHAKNDKTTASNPPKNRRRPDQSTKNHL